MFSRRYFSYLKFPRTQAPILPPQAGLAVLVLVTPLNLWASKWAFQSIWCSINLMLRRGETLLERQLKAKDQRIKLMSEILAGIKVDFWSMEKTFTYVFFSMKVLKLYAWEMPFMRAIDAIRGGEIKVLRWIAKLWALANFTFSSVPFLMTLATFLTFIYRWHLKGAIPKYRKHW